MKPQHLVVCIATAAGLCAALPAAAQFQKPEDAVKYRKSVMTVMANHFGRIGAMVNGRAPFDAATAAANADLTATLSRQPFIAFVDGTSSTDKGGAKANIWTERAKFDESAKKMQDEMAKLNAAAKTGNLDQIKTAFGGVGNACKACHDDFRNQ
jgi:cytochrome c556